MPITLILAVLCGALALVPESIASALALDRHAVSAGALWCLWSGHLVHFSAQHAVLDIATLLIAGGIAEREMGTPATGLALVLGAPAIAIVVLLAAPQLEVYRGASGLAVLLGTAAGILLWQRNPGVRGVLAGLAIALLAKTSLDAAGLLPGLSSLPDGVRVAWQAHDAGGALGALAALYAASRNRRRLATGNAQEGAAGAPSGHRPA
ncbi:MAG: rhomboid family intramembrane serine protease [Zoogloea sp.]|nr:rhomboid family intramembrane serine protease [Zoogloea sp.]